MFSPSSSGAASSPRATLACVVHIACRRGTSVTSPAKDIGRSRSRARREACSVAGVHLFARVVVLAALRYQVDAGDQLALGRIRVGRTRDKTVRRSSTPTKECWRKGVRDRVSLLFQRRGFRGIATMLVFLHMEYALQGVNNIHTREMR